MIKDLVLGIVALLITIALLFIFVKDVKLGIKGFFKLFWDMLDF